MMDGSRCNPDTVSNTDADLLKEMSVALAYATATYAVAPRG